MIAPGGRFDIETLIASLQFGGGAGTKPIGLRSVEIGFDAVERLPAILADVTRMATASGPVVVLTDAVPKSRRGVDVTDLVVDLAGRQREVQQVAVRDRNGVHADAATVSETVAAVAGACALVTVGSGTVVDIGKAVSASLDGLGHIVVQTALSVNGFADDQSVLLINGVKRTTQTRWADALIADIGVLAEAPLALNLAGIGDLLAMFTAPADWQLANLLGMGDGYSSSVVALVRVHGPALLAAAPGLKNRDPAAIDLVARVLTLSGLSMGVAGCTAPSSGSEHTVSHLIEMATSRSGAKGAFHGAQVGVATVLAALVWEHVRRRVAQSQVTLSFPSDETMQPHVRDAFSFLDPSGAMGDECWKLYRRKLARWRAREKPLSTFDWDGADRAVSGLLAAPEELVATLVRSGAPTRFADLAPPVEAATARWALANCHLLRERFSILDLAFFAGVWEPDDVEAILDRAARLGAGL